MTPQAVVCRFDEGETVTDRPERTIRILCAHDLLDLTWTRYEPGERGPDPHVHHRHVDAFYVLEGELVFGLGPQVEKVRAPAGTFVAAPPNLVHTFGNESDERACFLNLHAPSTGFADNLRGRGEFDSHAPPADGGRPLGDGVVQLPGEGELSESDERRRWVKGEFAELSVIEFDMAPGWGVPAHHHDDHLDSFFVLAGEVEFATATGPVTPAPWTFVGAPPGALHGFRNASAKRARALNVHAPDAGFVARNR